MSPANSFTGRSRHRQTRLSVRVVDRLTSAVITIGGIGAIAAVLAVFVFLLSVSLPLLWPAHVAPQAWADRAVRDAPAHLESLADGHAWAWLPESGALSLWSTADGAEVARATPFPEQRVTAAQFETGTSRAVFGLADGAVQTARVEVVGQEIRCALDEPLFAAAGQPVLCVDAVLRGNREIACRCLQDGRVAWVQRTRSAAANQPPKLRQLDLTYKPHGEAPPKWIMLSALGDTVCLAWEDGNAVRFQVQGQQAAAVGTVDLAPGPEGRLTALTWLAGRTTLLAGDAGGKTTAWFVARPGPRDRGEPRLVAAHELIPPGNSPGGQSLGNNPLGSDLLNSVTAIGCSRNLRVVAVGYGNGSTHLFHVTSHKHLGQVASPRPGAIASLAWSPASEELLLATGEQVGRAPIDLRHPEVSWASLTQPVWYEGFWQPTHAWQSSGSDQFEPKFGFWPLVFGTLKATFYSMLLSAPLALLAALYTSEFMAPQWRLRIKPAVELMASLPSVVLGFMAGLVIAPFVEAHVASVLLLIPAIPMAWMLGAYLWQLLPMGWTLRIGQGRLVALAVAMILGAVVAWQSGHAVEQALFQGDIKLWLSGGEAFRETWGGWLALLLAPIALVVVVAQTRLVDPRWRAITSEWSRPACAAAELAKFLLALAAIVGLSALGATLLQHGGYDPRGGFIGPYDQRNSLIVGFAMSFAVVPIIYTIAEDALSSVPAHLRSAALGAGATPWQTAATVVIPTAMSGLFSAVMVGLGRAVGETMIVLMATGGTPVLDWNLFNGFRTLSATIAEEIPEAEVGGTHYRVLFLAALTLFAMTFLINFLAERVRQRFRQRAYQL